MPEIIIHKPYNEKTETNMASEKSWYRIHHQFIFSEFEIRTITTITVTVGDVDSEANSARKVHKNIFVENVIKTSLNYSYLKIAH